MNEIIERLRVVSRDMNARAVCVGPETYYELMALTDVGSQLYFNSDPHQMSTQLQIYGVTVVAIPGIPPGEIVVSSYPKVSLFRDMLEATKPR